MNQSRVAQDYNRWLTSGSPSSIGYSLLASVPGSTLTNTPVFQLAQNLQLRPEQRLLDIGCGRGYPGWFIAKETGCRVVGADLPIPSLRAAVHRARRNGVARRASFVAASALALPFQPHSFDAITHTDVLC